MNERMSFQKLSGIFHLAFLSLLKLVFFKLYLLLENAVPPICGNSVVGFVMCLAKV